MLPSAHRNYIHSIRQYAFAVSIANAQLGIRLEIQTHCFVVLSKSGKGGLDVCMTTPTHT